MAEKSRLVEQFKDQAALVSTVVAEAGDLSGAIDYALRIALAKPPLKPLMPVAGEGGPRPVLAAPGLTPSRLEELTRRGREAGVEVIAGGLRGRMAGIDVGFSLAALALADTATLVLSSPGEDERLAGMISEIHVVALDQRRIAPDSRGAESFLAESLAGTGQVSFISGCSRTSDIERVLALGVHGPLELHVVLMTGGGHDPEGI